jgi:hypothetical protein
MSSATTATIAGTTATEANMSVVSNGRLEVHGDHTSAGDMTLHSEHEKVILDADSSLTYHNGNISGALGVDSLGSRTGDSNTISAPGATILEAGKVQVKESLYEAGDVSFAGNLSESKILKIKDAKSVKFLKGANIQNDGVLSITSKDLQIDKESEVTGGSVDVTVDEGKIAGALKSLSTLVYNGHELHVENGGLISGKGDLSIHGDIVELAKGGAIHGASGVLAQLKNITLASHSDIEGNFVQIQASGAFSNDGQITANEKIHIILESDQAKNIRGHLQANGWVMIDGKIDSDTVVALVTGNEDRIQGSTIKVVTTEPVVIKKNIDVSYGVVLSAPSLEVDKEREIKADSILMVSNAGDLTLDSGSKIKAIKSVKIFAAGDLIRSGEERSDGTRGVARSSIEAGDDGIILSTDGTYRDTASYTKTTGQIIVHSAKGLVIVPIKQVFTSTTTEKRWYGRKSTTTTNTHYTNTTMEAKELAVESGAPSDVTNWVYNGDRDWIYHADPKKVHLHFAEGNSFTIKQLQDSSISSVSKSYHSFVAPFAATIAGADQLAHLGRKITAKTLRMGETILRELGKPITQNVSGSERIFDHLFQVTNAANDSVWDISSPTKIYKVDTYKNLYEGVKQEVVGIILDAQKIESKLVHKISEEALSKLSQDLANLADDSVKIQEKIHISMLPLHLKMLQERHLSIWELMSGCRRSTYKRSCRYFYSKKSMNKNDVMTNMAVGRRRDTLLILSVTSIKNFATDSFKYRNTVHDTSLFLILIALPIPLLIFSLRFKGAATVACSTFCC